MDINCSCCGQVIAKGSGRIHRTENDNKELNRCVDCDSPNCRNGACKKYNEAFARAANLPEGFQFYTILIRD